VLWWGIKVTRKNAHLTLMSSAAHLHWREVDHEKLIGKLALHLEHTKSSLPTLFVGDPTVTPRTIRETTICATHCVAMVDLLLSSASGSITFAPPLKMPISHSSMCKLISVSTNTPHRSTSEDQSSSQSNPATSMLALRHVGYGVDVKHLTLAIEALVDVLQASATRDDRKWPALGATYRSACARLLEPFAQCVASAARALANVPKIGVISSRKWLLLQALWEQLRGTHRGDLTKLFYECLRADSAPIHDFIAPRVRERAVKADVFRQLLGALCEHAGGDFAQHVTSMCILFDTLLGVASAQYSVSLFDAVVRATQSAVSRALGAARAAATSAAVRIATSRLSIALARIADVGVEGDLFRAAEKLIATSHSREDDARGNDGSDGSVYSRDSSGRGDSRSSDKSLTVRQVECDLVFVRSHCMCSHSVVKQQHWAVRSRCRRCCSRVAARRFWCSTRARRLWRRCPRTDWQSEWGRGGGRKGVGWRGV
jgi:hypothetical protein